MCAPSGQTAPSASPSKVKLFSASSTGTAGDRSVATTGKRLPAHRAADHSLGELLSRCAGSGSMLLKKLPEPADVLPQIAQHQVGAVAAEIAFGRVVLGAGQQRRGARARVEQRTVGISAVFVWVAKQKFAERGNIAVFEIEFDGRCTAIPVDCGLAQAVCEAEWLVAVLQRRIEPLDRREGRFP